MHLLSLIPNNVLIDRMINFYYNTTCAKEKKDTSMESTDRAQCAEGILNTIAKAINQTFAGLKCMSQGFKI